MARDPSSLLDPHFSFQFWYFSHRLKWHYSFTFLTASRTKIWQGEACLVQNPGTLKRSVKNLSYVTEVIVQHKYHFGFVCILDINTYLIWMIHTESQGYYVLQGLYWAKLLLTVSQYRLLNHCCIFNHNCTNHVRLWRASHSCFALTIHLIKAWLALDLFWLCFRSTVWISWYLLKSLL